MMTVLIPALAVLFVCGLIIKSLCYRILPTNKFFAWLYFIPTSTPTKPVSGVDRAELQRVFAMFDRNSDGFITKQELGESFKSLKLFTTDSELLSMVEKLDTNGDGIIDVDEFQVLYETMGAKKKKNMEEEDDDDDDEEEEEDDDDDDDDDEDNDEDEVDDEDLKEAFKVFDENHDGLITAEELQSVISCLGLKQGRSVEEARDMINKVDKDGDGMVNFKEFKEMMKSSKPKTS